MASSTSTNERGPTLRGSSLPKHLRAGAFWAAVLLPFLSVGLLFGGIGSTLGYLILAGLVATNVVALILGHGYRR